MVIAQQERAGTTNSSLQETWISLIAEHLKLLAPVAGRAVKWQLLHLGQRLVVWQPPQALMTDVSPKQVGHHP